ncbi:MAG TPA: hypothetical protein VF741_09110, partial [Candidatus Aquilonibacter sp.]
MIAIANGRGAIRPLLRAALFVADCVLVAFATLLAPTVGDIHSASWSQLALIGAILLVTGTYVQFRYESARTFDFHDVVRLLVGAASGALLALLFEEIPSPLTAASGRLVVIAATLAFVLRMFSRIALVLARSWWRRRRPQAKRVLIVGHGIAAHQIAKAIFEDERVPMRVVGCVEDGISERRIDGVRVLGKLHQLPELVRKEGVDTVIIAIVG